MLGGCGGNTVERGAVHGHITFRGKEIEEGTIVFNPIGETKGPPAGARIVNGDYSIIEMDGPVVGSHRVEIQAFRKTGRKVPDLLGDVSNPNRPMIDEVIPLLPPQFNLESGLTSTIEPGDNEVDFDL
jgi:hypothetical protein